MKKRINKILWYGSELEDGKAKAPSASVEENGLDGLNEGELYIANNEEDPALFTRTSNDKIVRLGEGNYKPFKFEYDESIDALVLSRTDGKPAHFLATGALSTRGLGNTEEGGTGGGMDHVYNVDDFSKALDSFNKVSETDTFNAYAIRSLYEMVKNIENSSTDTSYVDGKIEEVNKKIDTNTAYLSDWIERTGNTLQGNIDAVESALLENIDTVAGDLSTLQATVNDFLTGTDTDTIINRWKELEAFLNGYTETATLADLLSGKADKATTLAGYGITNAYTKTEVDSKITSVNTSVTTLQTTVSGHTTSINSLQTTVSGHTSSITSINSKITTLQSYFENGVAKSAMRLSDGAEYKAWGRVFFRDGKPVDVSGAGTFTQVNADSVLFKGKARLSYDSTLNALLLTKDDGTVVHFLASGAVATRGLGELDESGGGTGTGVNLLSVPSDIIPSVGSTYSLGASGKSWKELFVGDIQSGNIMPSSHYTYSLGADDNRWSKIYGVDIYATRFTMNGEPVATRNWVNSQSFAKASELTTINNSITALQASTFTGANNPEGYTLTWFTQSGGARNVTIPAYGEVGTVATDGLAGIGQKVALVDQWLIADLMDYVNEAVSGSSVDLSGYVLKEGGTINNPTLTGDVVGNGWSIEGGISYLNEVNASSLYVNDVAVTPSNYVTLNSAQNISGKKTFTGGIAVQNGITASHLYSVEYLDSSALTINAEVVDFTYDGDDSNLLVGLINGYKPLTLGNTSFSPALSNGTVIGTITIGGESKTIYAPSGSSVDLSNYVTLDGEQTITGNKTFTDINANRILLQGFELKPYNPDGGTPDRLMYDGYALLDEYNYSEYLDSAYVKKSGDTVRGKLGFSGGTYPQIYGDGNYLSLSPASDGLYGLTFDKSNTAIRARGNNNTRLGISGFRWSNVYSVLGDFSGQITSSVADGTAPFVVTSKTEVANLHSATATKLHTARTIAISGAVTGTATTFDGSSNISINTTSVDASKLSGYARVYYAHHPEDGGILPFIYNDLAHLIRRGGSCTIYKTTDTDYTQPILTNAGTIGSDYANLFDGSPSYFQYSVSSLTDVVVIDIDCPEKYSYSTQFYIDFGNNSWTAKSVKVYVWNDDESNTTQVYTKKAEASVWQRYSASISYSYSNGTSTIQGFNKLRVVLTDFVEKSPRIAQIGLITYNSPGLRKGYMSRGIDDQLYRSLTPAKNLTYNLGNGNNRWLAIYGTNADFTGSVTTQSIIGVSSKSLVISSTNDDLALRRNNTDATSVVLNSSAFKPYNAANGLLDLGSTSARWKGIYGQTLDLGGHIYLPNYGTIYAKNTSGSNIGLLCFSNINNLLIGQNVARAGYNTNIYGNTISLAYGTAGLTANTALFVNSDGNVGIGTTSPTYKLDVNGTFHASGDATFDTSVFIGGSRLRKSKSALLVDTGETANNAVKASVMQVNTAGVADDIDWAFGVISQDSTDVNTVGSGVGIVLGGYSSGSFTIGRGSGIASVVEEHWYNRSGLAFYVNHSNSTATDNFTEKLRLTYNGNLIPKYNTSTQSLGSSDARWIAYLNSVDISGNTTIGGSLTVNGVGITGATTDGVNQLTIDGEIHSDYICWFDEIEVATGIGSDKWSIYDGEASFTSIQSGNVLPKSNGSGNVGSSSLKWLNGYFNSLYSDAISVETLIPRNTPYISVNAMSLDLYECELYGYDSNNLDVWNVDFAGNAYFQSVTQSSDIRYKNIKENVHLKLSDIAAAPTFKFSWANDTDGSTHIGTSAQYWQGIASELVVANKKTGKLGLDYSTAALVSAVSIAREVNTIKMWQTTTTDRIEELEGKVKKLEEENKVLRELLNNNIL